MVRSVQVAEHWVESNEKAITAISFMLFASNSRSTH
jgi:hypothetical protein